tara:strand:+ start:1514 stop:1891 length:378 start_codon:yes stop_codon:yes gene_type:complete
MTKYAWYIDRNQLALVEKENGKWISVKTSDKKMQVHATAIPKSGSNESYFTGDPLWQVEALLEIPKQFHEALVLKAIAMGYQKPPAINPQLSEFFTAQYLDAIKRAKTYVKSQKVSTGFIKPQDF